MDDDVGARMQELSDEVLVDPAVLDRRAPMDVEVAPLGADVTLDLLARRLPKAVLHLHLSGSVRPSTLRLLAHEQGNDPDTAARRPDGVYDYWGFGKFIADMQRSARLLSASPGVTREVVLDVLGAEVDAGARHVELMVTIGYYQSIGVDAGSFLAAIDDAFTTAAEVWDLSGGIILEFDRGAGPEAALAVAELAVDARERGLRVLGVGNDGDPLTVPFADLGPAYERARAGGLRLCGHVDLPDDVAPALDLGLDRIDHGYAVLYDPELLARAVEAQVPFTICPTSNILQMPGLTPDFDAHALAGLVAAGIHVTLHPDDPPMFFTDTSQEYRAAGRTLSLGREDLAAMARRSLDAAWTDDDARRERWASEIDALLADPRWSDGRPPT